MATQDSRKDTTLKRNEKALKIVKSSVLQKLNILRVPFIVDGLKNNDQIKEDVAATVTPLKGLTILDVKCGNGILTEHIAKLGPEAIVGIDSNSNEIDDAVERASLSTEPLPNLSYSVSSIEDHAKDNHEKYDAILAFEIIEHVAEPEEFLKSCVECLKPGGSIFVTTINKTWYSWLLGVLLLETLLNKIPRGTHEWKKFITPSELREIFRKNDCTTKLVRGVTYNVLKNKMVWTTSTSFVYAVHAVKNE